MAVLAEVPEVAVPVDPGEVDVVALLRVVDVLEAEVDAGSDVEVGAVVSGTGAVGRGRVPTGAEPPSPPGVTTGGGRTSR